MTSESFREYVQCILTNAKRDMFHETVQSFKSVEKIQFPTCNVYGYTSNLVPLTIISKLHH